MSIRRTISVKPRTHAEQTSRAGKTALREKLRRNQLQDKTLAPLVNRLRQDSTLGAVKAAKNAAALDQIFKTSASREARAGTPQAPTEIRQQFVYRVPPGTDLAEVRLKGSFDAAGNHSHEWSTRPMKETEPGSGLWVADVALRHRGEQEWKYGFETTLSTGRSAEWAVNSPGVLRFDPLSKTVAMHSPVTYDLNGATRQGNNLHFRQFFPDVNEVSVKVLAQGGRPEERIPLTRDAEGYFTGMVRDGADRLMGRPYVYEFRNSKGDLVQKNDMYAEVLQGTQRGVNTFHLHNLTDSAAHEYWKDTTPFTQFTVPVQFSAGEKQVFLVLKDEAGRPLSKAALEQRIKRYEDPDKVLRVREGKFNDLWSQSVDDAGRISMVNVNNSGNFSTLVNNPEALVGLKYEFQDASGRRLGEKPGVDPATLANDPWDNTLTRISDRDVRAALITPRLQPVKRREATPSSLIYQLHPSSFMTQPENMGVDVATMKDVMAYFKHLKDSGVTDLQWLPHVQTQMAKTWAYEGFGTQATQSGLGFTVGEGANARWVSGAEAVRLAVEAAHAVGLNVTSDVVFNHLFEPAKPDVYDRTGDGKNVWVDRDPGKDGTQAFKTDWGDQLNLNNPHVDRAIYDYSHYLTNVLGFDGVRFDFTQPIADGGGGPLLQRVNSMLHAMGVDTRIAENFPYTWHVTKTGGEGLGFTHTLHLELEHAFHNHDKVMSELGRAGKKWDLNLDRIMHLLTENPSISGGFGAAVMGNTTHDEVGNGARALLAAMGYDAKSPREQRSRDLLGMFHLVTLAMAPGRAMFFSGDDNGAMNPFKWGLPTTWGEGSRWVDDVKRKVEKWKFRLDEQSQNRYLELAKDANSDLSKLPQGERALVNHLKPMPAEDREAFMVEVSRVATQRRFSDLANLRRSVPELASGTHAGERLFVHNADGVMAVRRPSKDGDLVIVANARDPKTHYDKFRLPPGVWQEIHNTDSAAYGGSNFGNAGARKNGGEAINLPTGGVIFRKVG